MDMTRHEYIAVMYLLGHKGPNGKPIFSPFGKNFQEIGSRFESLLTPEQLQAVEILANAKIDLSYLQTGGRKGIFELLEEVGRGEAFLQINPETEGVIRFAESIHLFIRYRSWLWLRERWRFSTKKETRQSLLRRIIRAFRRFLFNFVLWRFFDDMKLHGVSETRIRGEEINFTTVMAVTEELLFSLTSDEIDGILIDATHRPIDKHPSKAYAGLESRVLVIRLLLTLHHWRWSLLFGKVIIDTLVEVYTKWQFSRQMPPGDWIARREWKPVGREAFEKLPEHMRTEVEELTPDTLSELLGSNAQRKAMYAEKLLHRLFDT